MNRFERVSGLTYHSNCAIGGIAPQPQQNIPESSSDVCAIRLVTGIYYVCLFCRGSLTLSISLSCLRV